MLPPPPAQPSGGIALPELTLEMKQYPPPTTSPSPRNDLTQLDTGLQRDFLNKRIEWRNQALRENIDEILSRRPSVGIDSPLPHVQSQPTPLPSEPLPFLDRPSRLQLTPNLRQSPPFPDPPISLNLRSPALQPTQVIPPSGTPLGSLVSRGAVIGAGIDFGIRLASGQPSDQAAMGAAAAFGGSLLGGALGSVLGPGGAVAGSFLGGMAAGALSDYLFNLNKLPKSGEIPKSTPQPIAPFYGGQENGIKYLLTWESIFDPPYPTSSTVDIVGPLKQIKLISPDSTGRFNSILIEDGQSARTSHYTWLRPVAIGNISLKRIDGLPDTSGYPPSELAPDNRSPDTRLSPLNNGTPTGYPQSVPQSRPDNYAPGAPLQQPLPNLEPLPQLQRQPQQQREPLPFAKSPPPARLNLVPNFAIPNLVEPQSSPTPTPQPTEPSPTPTIPGMPPPEDFRSYPSQPQPSLTPTPVEPIPISAPQPGLPTQIPISIPQSQSQPLPTPAPVTTTPSGQPQQDSSTDLIPINRRLDEIGIALTGITQLLNNQPTPTPRLTRDDICELAQPTNCLGSPVKQVENKVDANAQKLDQLNAALNGLNLAGLNGLSSGISEINNKLGAQIPNGGISNFLIQFYERLNKIAEWMHLDRILNVLIWWQTLHNAYMLSSNLSQTLFSTISNVLAAIGIKDVENNPLDIGKILGGQVDTIAKTIFGVEEWNGMKSEWKKFNRIYQAAANLLNSIQNIGNSILSALQIVGERVSVIGNALRISGVVQEKIYSRMPTDVNFQNKWFTRLESIENGISQVNQVASEVLSVQDTFKQIGEQQKEFNEALGNKESSEPGKEISEKVTYKPPATIPPFDLKESDKNPD